VALRSALVRQRYRPGRERGDCHCVLPQHTMATSSQFSVACPWLAWLGEAPVMARHPAPSPPLPSALPCPALVPLALSIVALSWAPLPYLCLMYMPALSSLFPPKELLTALYLLYLSPPPRPTSPSQTPKPILTEPTFVRALRPLCSVA
jgi:hypothetical protein